MENSAPASGGGPPPKPWERAGSSSGPVPFKPPSAGNTSDVVEASGTAQPGLVVSTAGRNASVNTNTLGRHVPARPWEQQTYGNSYGGYGSGLNYNSGMGSGMYGGGSYGGLGGSYGGGSYGGGLYGNNMYRGGYGGLYGGGTYGGGMYGAGLGGPPVGGYGMGMGGPLGDQDPNNPYGPPSSPPNFWVSLMRVMQGVVSFFGRIAILIDQNTQAFHMFMTALLQLFDRSGMLYGELARFVLRILGVRTKPKKVHPPDGAEGLPGSHHVTGTQNSVEGPKAVPSGGWDSVWGDTK
ncbi:Peroxisomal membrane protein PAS20 [Orobanche hederae]